MAAHGEIGLDRLCDEVRSLRLDTIVHVLPEVRIRPAIEPTLRDEVM